MTSVQLLTEEQAAQALKLCVSTLRKERRAGNLPYILIGRAVRYAPDDLSTFIERKRQIAVVPTVTTHKGRKASANRSKGNIVPFSAREHHPS